jgi:protein O-GlcNAc transferase
VDGEQLRQSLYEAATHHQAGRLADAEQLYLRVLETQAANPEANHNIAVLAMQTGKGMSIAIPYFRKAWQADPSHHQHWLSYLRALAQVGDLPSAKKVYADGRNRGLQGPDPEQTPASSHTVSSPAVSSGAGEPAADLGPQYSRILQLLKKSNFKKAEKNASNLCERYPDQVLPWKAYGLALKVQGKDRDALASFKKSVQLGADDAETWFEFGDSLSSNGLFGEAEKAFSQSLSVTPEFPGAAPALARVLLKLYRPSEAEAICRKVLAADSSSVKSLYYMGKALQAQGRDEEALVSFQQALESEPDNVEAYLALGKLLHEYKRETDLIALCLKMISAAPKYFPAHRDLGAAYLRTGRVQEAAESFAKGLKLRPDDLATRSNWLFCCNYSGALSGEAMRDEARVYGRHAAARAKPFKQWLCDSAPPKLRVGLVSSDLREHPVGFFLENVLAQSDRSRVEWIAYPTQTVNDAVAQRLKGHVAQWTVLAGMNARDCAEKIQADGVHVLIDLDGHSGQTLLPAFAYRPAPVQVSWLGYFATTGLAEMDYFIADPVSVGPEQHVQFTEAVWSLPDCRLCFTAPVDAPQVSELPALSREHVTFACFQNLPKITDDLLEAWAEILGSCPSARLRVQSMGLASEESRVDFSERAQSCGIPALRLDVYPPVSRSEYLENHADVDILLDTFGFPGGTTTCEALWMGVPTVTLAGNTLLSRQGASLLTAAGLSSWVTTSRDAYIQQAIERTENTDALAQLRSGLRQQVAKSSLYDAEPFAHNLISALWGMWQAKGGLSRAGY